MAQLKDRYRHVVTGEVSCFDRVVITGTLTEICHSTAVAQYLLSRGRKILDLPRVFEPMKGEIVANANEIAAAHGLKIEYITRRSFRKDDRVREIVAERGEHPGLVHIFSALESVNTFRAAVRRATGRPSIGPRRGKCLHYYFYFIDPDFGLCYLRVSTWAPFRLQF
ncbi:MAG: MarR family transcriptional regulator, partial [Acidobacteria bacterium]|nr:MarR family transcriptional regulator [Acidobacteriota bacterium]